MSVYYKLKCIYLLFIKFDRLKLDYLIYNPLFDIVILFNVKK